MTPNYPLDRIGLSQPTGATVLNFDHPQIRDLFPQYVDPARNDSAAFLIWYLENYYRLDQQEAQDSVCDKQGDKGIDGVFVNDNNETITVFQSRIIENSEKTTGEAALQKFAGALTQFKDAETVQALIESVGDAPLGKLLSRMEITKKISSYELQGEFLTNVDLHPNGASYLESTPNITFVGKTALTTTYISAERDIPPRSPVTFDISNFSVGEYTGDSSARAIIAPIKATELVRLDGVTDQSLFAYNVRGPLGKTAVNRGIVDTLKNPALHKSFPLFHNGITIIADKVIATKEAIEIRDYFVVNGCQSLTALHSNAEKLSDDLRVLVKFIECQPKSELARNITAFSNNQNGVLGRDFAANTTTQIRLQNEVRRCYAGEYEYEIKRGEKAVGSAEPISNEEAGLLMWAFDLREPWATHRRYQVFREKEADLFGAPYVTADRIVFCNVLSEEVGKFLPQINNHLFAKYVLTKYMIVYLIRSIFDTDPLGKELVTNPGMFVKDVPSRNRFRECLRILIKDLVIDLNGEVDQHGENFDYRDKLRNDNWVRDLSKKLVAEHLKLVARKRIASFKEEWDKTGEKHGATEA